MALSEQRKDAQKQFLNQKQQDVLTLIQVEKQMAKTVENYDLVTFDLNVEKTKYSDLASQLQQQTNVLLKKFGEVDKVKNQFQFNLSSLEKQFSNLKDQNILSNTEETKMNKQILDL